MEITLVTTKLASEDLALGRVGPFRMSLNGQQLVDDAQFFRAAAAKVFARGNVGTVLQFSVTRLFATVKAAEVFALTHAGSVPKQGLVTAVCGEVGDQQTVYLEDAVLESCPITEFGGKAAVVQYTIKGGLWTTDVPPEVPGETEDEEEFIVMRRGKISIAAAATSVEVTFSSPLSAVPVVFPTVSRPTGGDNIRATLREDTVATTGFTVDLSSETPNTDYVLHYMAVE